MTYELANSLQRSDVIRDELLFLLSCYNGSLFKVISRSRTILKQAVG